MKFIFILLLFIIVYMPNNSIQGLDEKENVYYGKLMKLLALNSKTNLEKGDPYLTSFDTEDAKKTLTNDTKTSPTDCHTIGGPDAGSPCAFPFYYKGYKYMGCIDKDESCGENGNWCATKKRWGFCNENCPKVSIGEYIELPTNLNEEGKEITDDKEKHVTILRSKTLYHGEPNRSFRLPSTSQHSTKLIESGFRRVALSVNGFPDIWHQDCGGEIIYMKIFGGRFQNVLDGGLQNYIDTGEYHCEEEIVKNPDGFWQNEDFTTTLTRDCTTAYFDYKNLQVKLCGWQNVHKNTKNKFCPSSLTLLDHNGAMLKANFEGDFVHCVTKPLTLIGYL